MRTVQTEQAVDGASMKPGRENAAADSVTARLWDSGMSHRRVFIYIDAG